jgi:hypothetical protein
VFVLVVLDVFLMFLFDVMCMAMVWFGLVFEYCARVFVCGCISCVLRVGFCVCVYVCLMRWF